MKPTAWTRCPSDKNGWSALPVYVARHEFQHRLPVRLQTSVCGFVMSHQRVRTYAFIVTRTHAVHICAVCNKWRYRSALSYSSSSSLNLTYWYNLQYNAPYDQIIKALTERPPQGNPLQLMTTAPKPQSGSFLIFTPLLVDISVSVLFFCR